MSVNYLYRVLPLSVNSLPFQPTANNTLDDSGCPLAGDSDEQVNAWVDIYATPIAQRLNSRALGMTSNLTATDVHNLISLCPFDSVAKEKLSQFCNLFEPEEFVSFEWGLDLDKYYGTGYVETPTFCRLC